MAEIIGVIGVAGQAVSTCYAYVCAFKDAPREAASLLQSLNDLRAALIGLQSVQAATSDVASGDQIAALAKAIDDSLQDILKRLKGKAPAGQQSSWQRKLQQSKWPLSRQETLSMMEDIERQKSTLQLYLDKIQVDLTSKGNSDLAEIKRAVETEGQARKRDESSAHRETVLSWLSKYLNEDKLQNVLQRKHRSSGQWIFSDEQWCNWKDQHSALLWLHGKSGSGKTVLAAHIIQHLLHESSTNTEKIFYFFCDSRDASTISQSAIASAILRQFCSMVDELPQVVEDAFGNGKGMHGREHNLSLTELEMLLANCLSQNPQQAKTIIIDAINEAEDQEELLAWLVRLMQLPSHRIKVIVTSTSQPRHQDTLMPILTLSISGQQHSADINAFLLQDLAKRQNLRRLDTEQKAAIAKALNGGADGSFLWVRCHLDRLSRLRLADDMMQALEGFTS